MVKGGAAGPGVYSATYSNIPVWEFQFGDDLKEHVMRRRYDDYINATHILKAAGFDKPARTRILEREVQKGEHEKVQGGYGKYQGTWVPLASGAELARRNNIYDKLATIFEFVNGNVSPPPAPKHTTSKPKAPKKPAVPKFNTSEKKHFPHVFPPAHYLSVNGVGGSANSKEPVVPQPPARLVDEDMYDAMSIQGYNEGQTPDDTTVASFMDEDRYDNSAPPTGGRKRKRSPGPPALSVSDQAHMAYADELLDYFLLSQASEPAHRPEPPPNFQPDWQIDTEGHTALHWAAAMGDLEVMKQLRSFGANPDCRNVRGETPLMRATLFTNCLDKQSMPRVAQELISTITSVDNTGSTAIHHAATLTQSRNKHHCARYYLDVILNKCVETMEQDELRAILDIQDLNGSTACHIAAANKARKCLRALMGRGASTDIPDIRGIRVETLIPELNATRRPTGPPPMSSSPFGPESVRRNMSLTYPEPSERTPRADLNSALHQARREAHHSEAAQTVSSKITPAIVSKFQDLARSFDEELKEREGSEREARRILSQSQMELAGVQRQIQELTEGNEEEAPARHRNELNQLEHAQSHCISLVEQQQAILLSSLISQNEASLPTNGLSNGTSSSSSQDPQSQPDAGEMVALLLELRREQEKRQELVNEYTLALADKGQGEMTERYRRLTAKCLGLREAEVDEQLDALLGVLEEDAGDERVERES